MEVQSPTIEIKLGPDGNVIVTGPLANKVLCLGMLVQAIHVVNTLEIKEASALVLPTPRFNHLRR